MAIKDAFLPIDPSTLGTPVAQSVQCALYMRLRKTHGKNAGNLGWLLVRLGQPNHREHDEACSAIMTRPSDELATLTIAVTSARTAAKTADARELCVAILDVLGLATAVAGTRKAT
jgi:hypothetical protein